MIEILHPGIYNTVQDQGRWGYAHWGVPSAGPMDPISARLGNHLLANPSDAALIEISLGQGVFRFQKATIFCLSGGDFSPQLNGRPLKMNRPIQAEVGAILKFGRRRYGARCYLAVLGGILSEEVLNSRSFFPGITPLRLEKGDEIPLQERHEKWIPRNARSKPDPDHFKAPLLDCFPGPEYDQLSAAQQKTLAAEFSVSTDNNRVGYRLQETLPNELASILTSAVLPGTVQLTGSGKMIVLMQDAQLSGGYPRILQLSEKALAQLSQKIAGDRFRFKLRSLR